MPQHLTPDLAERYRFRTVSKAELISADQHLATCEQCREMLGGREDLRAQVNSLRVSLEKSLESEHVGYEQLEAYVEGTLSAGEQEILDSHFKGCASCSEDLRDLQAFRNQLEAQKVLRSRDVKNTADSSEHSLLKPLLLRLRAAWLPASRWALAAFAVIAVAVAVRRAWESAHKPPILVHEPEKNSNPIPPVISKSAEVLLSSSSYLPPDLQAVVANAIDNQHIQTPQGLTDLALRRGEDQGFPLLTPVGTVVYSTTPVFVWKVAANADGYRVQVNDAHHNPVESSPVVTGTSWKSTVILGRGATYVWQLVIMVGGAEVEQSPLDVSQGYFKVLDDARLRQLNLVHPEDHFARGILLAYAGVLEEGAEEFRAVSPSDPNHSLATKFEREAQEMIVRQRAGLVH